MRKYLIAALVACTMFVPMFAPSVSAQRLPGPCAHWRHHRGGVVSDVKACTRRAIRRWHVHGGVHQAFKVESCESGFHPGATNGQYSGVFQIGDHEWAHWNRPQRYQRWFHGRPSPYHGAANVITGIFHASRAGWSAWSCAR